MQSVTTKVEREASTTTKANRGVWVVDGGTRGKVDLSYLTQEMHSPSNVKLFLQADCSTHP